MSKTDDQLEAMLTNLYSTQSSVGASGALPSRGLAKFRPFFARPWFAVIVGVLIVAIVGGVWAGSQGGKISAKNLMDGITAADVNAAGGGAGSGINVGSSGGPSTGFGAGGVNQLDAAVANFATGLLQQVATGDANYMVSPLSAELALAMAANGAAADTQAQMLQVLAGAASMDQLNAYLHNYVAGLPNISAAKLNIANSIWIKQGVDVKQSFLQANADWFGAAAYSAPFSAQTVKDMNTWVKQQTDGMIPRMVDSLDPSIVMILLNAMALDAQWASPYENPSVAPGKFTTSGGRQQLAQFMSSVETTYLDDGLATGFVKPYMYGTYDFVALLPNEGVSMQDYVASLTGAGLLNTLSTATDEGVAASLPQYSFSYSVGLQDALKALGMTNAFDSVAADFSNMFTDSAGMFIDDVSQRTYIDVTKTGTRAGAVTEVAATLSSAPLVSRTVNLDRPFVFAIVDGATHLPLFLGVVNTITT